MMSATFRYSISSAPRPCNLLDLVHLGGVDHGEMLSLHSVRAFRHEKLDPLPALLLSAFWGFFAEVLALSLDGRLPVALTELSIFVGF